MNFGMSASRQQSITVCSNETHCAFLVYSSILGVLGEYARVKLGEYREYADLNLANSKIRRVDLGIYSEYTELIRHIMRICRVKTWRVKKTSSSTKTSFYLSLPILHKMSSYRPWLINAKKPD